MTNQATDVIVFTTPLGPLRVEAVGGRITQAVFCEDPEKDSDVPILKVAEKQYQQFFEGQRCHFQLPLAPRGTAFQQRVWLALDRLDYAQLCSYTDIARQLGNPKMAQSVAQATMKNPIAIVIPCHRLVSQDGRVGSYAWGTERKIWLLDHERAALGEHPARGRITA